MNIGFFLDKANLEKVDCSRITEGNPGMGGSEYEFLLVSYLLEQRNNGIEPVLLTRSKINAPHNNVISIGGVLKMFAKSVLIII